MVDAIISSMVVKKSSFSVKVAPTRVSKKRTKEVSVQHAALSEHHVNTRDVPIGAYGKDYVPTTGVNPLDAKVSTTMVPLVHHRRSRVGSVGAMERDLGNVLVGRYAVVAPNATPWVT